MDTTIAEIARGLIEPLSESTKKLFSPLRSTADTYHLSVSLGEDNKQFILWGYQLSSSGAQYNLSTYVLREFIDRFPQHKHFYQQSTGHDCWILPCTDITAILLNTLWEPGRTHFTPDAYIVYSYLMIRFFKQTQAQRVVANYKENHITPEMPIGWEDHTVYPLTMYQKIATYNILNSEAYALFMKQGTGKTPPCINAICHLSKEYYAKTGNLYRALIVCPKAAAKSWQRKFHQFATVPGLVTVLKGTKLTRIKLLIEALQKDEDSKFTAIIVSYETMQKSWDAVSLLSPHIGILDESHFIKTPRTSRFKYCRILRDVCEKRVILTGTPSTNSMFDLWSQFEFLGDGLSGFITFEAFKAYYGIFESRGGFDKLVDYNNLPLLQERLARLAFILSKEEALPDLPKKRYDVIDIEMTELQIAMYTTLQEQLSIEIQSDIANSTNANKQLTANHILTKLLRLSQITSGYLVWDKQYDEVGTCTNEGAQKERIECNPKLTELMRILKEKGPNEKTLVFTNWVECIKMIHEALTHEGIKHVVYYGGTNDADRTHAETAYNTDPTIKVFVGNPAACGVALDLHGYDALNPDASTTNTTHVIYYSQDWSMVKREQSEDRAHRHVTRAPILVSDMIVSSSIDEEIYNMVNAKRENAERLQDVKDIMHRVLTVVPEREESDE